MILLRSHILRRVAAFACRAPALAVLCADPLQAADQPQWGEAWSRNQVSAERGLPAEFDLQSGRNVRWRAALGTQTHSTPVVAGGRVFIGTNNQQPRDPKRTGDAGVFMCFSERDGSLLWQLVVPKRTEDIYMDWPETGQSSPATVEGDRVYTVTCRGELVCLDVRGMENGNDGPFRDEGRHMAAGGEPPLEPGPLDADILWIADLMEVAGIWPHDGAHSSILIRGRHLYLNSGNGVDNTHRKIRRPDAPGLVVFDKETGAYLGRDDERTGPDVFHCTWSSPSMARIDGADRIFFCGGNGLVYAFEPLPDTAGAGSGQPLRTLNRIWQYDPDPEGPKSDVHRYTQNRREGPASVHGMPVVQNGRLYVAAGGDLWWGKTESWLHCIDAANGRQIWRRELGRHVLSTPAVTGDLVFIADTDGTVYCMNASTGSVHWTAEASGEFWASPYVADGKVYLGTRRGDFRVFAAAPEKRELHRINLGSPVSGTACAANGALYIATMKELIAIAAEPGEAPGNP